MRFDHFDPQIPYFAMEEEKASELSDKYLNLDEFHRNSEGYFDMKSQVPEMAKSQPCCMGIDEAGRGPVLGKGSILDCGMGYIDKLLRWYLRLIWFHFDLSIISALPLMIKIVWQIEYINRLCLF